MAKDPVCGMEVSEEGANFMIHFEHETFYFCSEKCKESYAQQTGIRKPASQKGFFGRFLEKMAKENAQDFGGNPPKCH
jgi:YHS domain-containing protein